MSISAIATVRALSKDPAVRDTTGNLLPWKMEAGESIPVHQLRSSLWWRRYEGIQKRNRLKSWITEEGRKLKIRRKPHRAAVATLHISSLTFASLPLDVKLLLLEFSASRGVQTLLRFTATCRDLYSISKAHTLHLSKATLVADYGGMAGKLGMLIMAMRHEQLRRYKENPESVKLKEIQLGEYYILGLARMISKEGISALPLKGKDYFNILWILNLIHKGFKKGSFARYGNVVGYLIMIAAQFTKDHKHEFIRFVRGDSSNGGGQSDQPNQTDANASNGSSGSGGDFISVFEDCRGDKIQDCSFSNCIFVERLGLALWPEMRCRRRQRRTVEEGI